MANGQTAMLSSYAISPILLRRVRDLPTPYLVSCRALSVIFLRHTLVRDGQRTLPHLPPGQTPTEHAMRSPLSAYAMYYAIYAICLRYVLCNLRYQPKHVT